MADSKTENSYSQIVKASALLGSAQALIYIASLIRGKAVAVLLGTSGIGALSLYQSTMQAVQTVANVGIPTSGVRDIAGAAAQGGEGVVNRSIVAVRRLTFLTALLGASLAIFFANTLSKALGQELNMSVDIKVLAFGVFFLCLTAGESAVLQGLGKLREVARTQVLSAVFAVPLLLGPCFVWGTSAIAPGLAASAALSWAITRHATRGIGNKSSSSWRELLLHSGPVLRLGVAVAGNATVASAVALGIRGLITKEAGLEANGILQAATMLAGISVTFLFSAMGTDFLPRLSAAKKDPEMVNQLVNEQTQVAVLLATPGLLLTIGLCPWLVSLFYSPEFDDAVALVPLFVAVNLLQVFGWPIGFVQMVLARSRTYVLTQVAFHVSQLALVVLLFPTLGLYAVCASFFASYAVYFVAVSLYARATTGFGFVGRTRRQLLLSTTMITAAVAAAVTMKTGAAATVSLFLSVVAAIGSARNLSSLLPQTHKLQPYLACSRFFSNHSSDL
jgi:antigen flippase